MDPAQAQINFPKDWDPFSIDIFLETRIFKSNVFNESLSATAVVH